MNIHETCISVKKENRAVLRQNEPYATDPAHGQRALAESSERRRPLAEAACETAGLCRIHSVPAASWAMEGRRSQARAIRNRGLGEAFAGTEDDSQEMV